MAEDPLVVFTPSGRRGRFAVGTPLLKAARSLGVDIDSVCGGRAICGRCQVRPGQGEFAKHGIVSRAEHISAANEAEVRYDQKKGIATGLRLSCQSRILGDLVIDVPAESQVHKQVVRKRAEVRDIELDPAIRLHYIEVAEPDMHNPTGDLERVLEALEAQWDLKGLECDLRVLQILQKVLREGGWKITAAIHRGQVLTTAWPGFHDSAYGVAVDIGSTTIAAHLCNLASGEVVASAGVMNPQIRFGEDLMSRVSYSMMNPGGATEMTQAVRKAVNTLIGQVAGEAGIARTNIVEGVFVGNPVMHHLLLGIDPVELGWAPFALATSDAMTLWAREIDISMHPDARLYVLPCIAGHVGADAAAVVLSESPHRQDEMMLVVDVGTNAEILLGNRDKLLACSSPTGPAFEGAQISSGQRAAPGAIERVRIDPETREPRFQVIDCEIWSDDPAFAAAIGPTGVTGICGSGIIEVIAEMRIAGIIDEDGAIGSRAAVGTERMVKDGRTWAYLLHDGRTGDGDGDGDGGGPLITVTQNDVRNIQLAKAALHSGARLLMDKMGVDQVDRVVLAGAFGAHISPLHAMVLGMIPDCPIDRVSSAGNAAGTGARIALLNTAARREIEKVVREIEKIETAVEPRFQEHFVNAIAVPHKTDAYPNLATLVSLPKVSFAAAGGAENGGRRRRRARG